MTTTDGYVTGRDASVTTGIGGLRSLDQLLTQPAAAMRFLLATVLVLLFPAALAAQPTDSFHVAAITLQEAPVRTVPLPGSYTAPDASITVARTDRALVLTLTGQAALDAFAGLPADAVLNTRSEALLRDAFAGSSDRLAAALPTHRREAGTRDFTRILDALAERRGTVTSVRALGTVQEETNMAATFVHVQFADGEETLKLRWRDGALALVTRGVLPTVTAHPIEGSTGRYAVLDAEGVPTTLLTFSGQRVVVQNAATTLVAERT